MGDVSIFIGSYAQGVITHADRAGRLRGSAALEIELVSVALPDGTMAPMNARSSSVEPAAAPQGPRQPPDVSRSTSTLPLSGSLAGLVVGGRTGGRIGLTAGVATLVLVPLLARGQDVELRQGMAIDVVIADRTD